MDKITDEVLLDYIDGSLIQSEAIRIKAAINANPQLRARLEELRLPDQHLAGSLESPSANFTDAVWSKISQAKGNVPKFSLNSFLIVFAAMITVVLGSYFMTDSIIDLDLSLKVPNTVTEYVEVPQVEIPQGISLKTVSQILLYSLSFLLLLILDKAILKPYFKKRRELLT
ncbi:MAG: hypothetical protein AAGG59_10340 [Bacteroidota bacterium]